MGWYQGAPFAAASGGCPHRFGPQTSSMFRLAGPVCDPANSVATATTIAAMRAPSRGGIVKPGDEMVVLPQRQSGLGSRRSGGRAATKVEEAFRFDGPSSVSLTDEIDIARGGRHVWRDRENQPFVGRDLDAMVCWFSDTKRVCVPATGTWCRTAAQTSHVEITGPELSAST